MEDYRLITMKECEEVEVQKCMDTIKEKNILVVYDEDIDYFYSHYLNLIKK